MTALERDVREFLEANPRLRERWEDLTPRQKLDYWLSWNGIQRYTDSILGAIQELWKVELP